MPKKHPSKPGSSKDAAKGKTVRSRSSRVAGNVALQSGDGERIHRDSAESVSDASQVADVPAKLTPGWAELIGTEQATRDVAKNGGKSTRKVHFHSPEARMKMKEAQRARRAREHAESKKG